MSHLHQVEECFGNAQRLTKLLDSFNINQIEQLSNEIWGHFFWFKKNGNFGVRYTNLHNNTLNRILVRIKKRQNKNRVNPEKSPLGSELIRSSFMDGSYNLFRRMYLHGEDWTSVAGHCFLNHTFGSEARLKLVVVCEGDVVEYICPSLEIYEHEIESLKAFYKIQ